MHGPYSRDLYFYGLTFEINVPKAMCQYLWEMPFYYYNYEPGTGPKSISVLNDGDAGSMLSCTIDGVAGTVSGNICSFPNGEGSITSSGAASLKRPASMERTVRPKELSAIAPAMTSRIGQV